MSLDAVSTRTRSKVSHPSTVPVQASPSSTDDAGVNATTEAGDGNKTLSAITRHLMDSPLCLKAVLSKFPHCFKVLSKARNLQHLKTLEAMYIKLRKPNLCVQKEYVIKLCLV